MIEVFKIRYNGLFSKRSHIAGISQAYRRHIAGISQAYRKKLKMSVFEELTSLGGKRMGNGEFVTHLKNDLI